VVFFARVWTAEDFLTADLVWLAVPANPEVDKTQTMEQERTNITTFEFLGRKLKHHLSSLSPESTPEGYPSRAKKQQKTAIRWCRGQIKIPAPPEEFSPI
jgi:hypothetical protein